MLKRASITLIGLLALSACKPSPNTIVLVDDALMPANSTLSAVMDLSTYEMKLSDFGGISPDDCTLKIKGEKPPFGPVSNVSLECGGLSRDFSIFWDNSINKAPDKNAKELTVHFITLEDVYIGGMKLEHHDDSKKSLLFQLKEPKSNSFLADIMGIYD